MQKRRIIKLSLAVGIVGSIVLPFGSVSAWGPERPTYTNEHPADHATFNSITNNVALGDERDFVRIAEIGGTYTSDLEIQPGKQYEVYIYYHNDASTTYDDKAHNYAGVARGTWLATRFPSVVSPGEKGEVSAVLSWQNFDLSDGNPGRIWDEAYVTAKEKVHLSYVEGTAKIHNSWAANNTILSDNLFNDGTYLGLDKLDGMILGCAEFSGNVTYTLQATGEDVPPTPPPGPDPTPPSPTPTPDPEPYIPSTPSELPNTGPAEVIAAVVIVVAIIAGGFYWYTTRKHLQKTTRNAAKGRSAARRKPATRKKTTTRRSPVKRSAVKRAQRKRAVKKVVRKRK